MTDFNGRRVVVTGASRGVGFESCKRLLDAGAEVLGVARDAERLAQASAQLNSLEHFQYLALDLSDATAPSKIYRAVQDRWGALDILVNNAGVQTWSESWAEEDPDLLFRDLQINLLGPHLLSHALLPCLLKGVAPRIVNVSTGAAVRSEINKSCDMPAYRISKMALNALTQFQATALFGRIAVNSLDPGWLKTDLGGSQAPGEPADGGERLMRLLEKSVEITGKFFHGDEEIQF